MIGFEAVWQQSSISGSSAHDAGVLSALAAACCAQPPASEIVLGIDPAKSNVHWALGSTVHTVHDLSHSRRGRCS